MSRYVAWAPFVFTRPRACRTTGEQQPQRPPESPLAGRDCARPRLAEDWRRRSMSLMRRPRGRMLLSFFAAPAAGRDGSVIGIRRAQQITA